MGQAALKYEQEPQETLLIPDGGIASFLTATEGDWADEKDLPQNGIAQVTHIADRLAEYGRHEDEYMVHAAEGETVIPMAVLEANPRLRKSLFAQMEMMGLEPESYVVGSELNSINPITGQPEFFLKKLFKGVKKLVKKVVKVVKKAVPYVLPIALAMTPLGPVYGAALGSGIGTLVQGGDLGDALKSAVIAGGIGGLTAGVKGGFKAGPGQFGEGFRGGVGDAFGNVGERFGQALGGARPEGVNYFGSPFRPIEAPAPTPDVTAATAPAPTPGSTANLRPSGYDPYSDAYSGSASPTTAMREGRFTPRIDEYSDAYSGFASPTTAMAEQAGAGPTLADRGYLPSGDGLKFIERADALPLDKIPETRNLLQKTGDFMFRAGQTPADIATNVTEAGNDYIAEMTRRGIKPTEAGLRAAEAAARPGMLARFGPSMALAGIGAAGAGFFDPPETDDEEEEEDFPEYDPEGYKKYMIDFPTAPNYTMADIRVPGRSVGFAEGGLASLEQFPRRSGRIAGPGTERSDDVPAMLSDGEFVMTARAVRGAGGGSRNNGMNKMYQMMRTFEGNA